MKADPVPAPKQDNTLLIVVLAIAGFWFMSQQQKPADDKPIQPQPASVQTVVSGHVRSLAGGYSSAFATAADLVASGELKTDKQLLEKLVPLTKSAREASQSPVDALLQAGLPRDEDRLKPEASTWLKSIADAYGKEARK